MQVLLAVEGGEGSFHVALGLELAVVGLGLLAIDQQNCSCIRLNCLRVIFHGTQAVAKPELAYEAIALKAIILF